MGLLSRGEDPDLYVRVGGKRRVGEEMVFEPPPQDPFENPFAPPKPLPGGGFARGGMASNPDPIPPKQMPSPLAMGIDFGMNVDGVIHVPMVAAAVAIIA